MYLLDYGYSLVVVGVNINYENGGNNKMITLEELRKRKAYLEKLKSEAKKKHQDDLVDGQLIKDIKILEHPRAYSIMDTIKKSDYVGVKTVGVGFNKVITKQLKIGAAQKKVELNLVKKRQEASIRRKVLADIHKKSVARKKQANVRKTIVTRKVQKVSVKPKNKTTKGKRK